MPLLTLEEQDEGRNSLQCLKGLFFALKKSHRITTVEHDLASIWLGNIDRIFEACKDKLNYEP